MNVYSTFLNTLHNTCTCTWGIYVHIFGNKHLINLHISIYTYSLCIYVKIYFSAQLTCLFRFTHINLLCMILLHSPYKSTWFQNMKKIRNWTDIDREKKRNSFHVMHFFFFICKGLPIFKSNSFNLMKTISLCYSLSDFRRYEINLASFCQ